ncbi:hypothetical protein A1355_16635 [Methylomonas koyamae]|uniref:Dienelactone hydrolase domain-containing protein n=2 Tax=Methylococcaceae TaxID=403 RepID=A0A177PGM7_9GAMM|nr:hypothetical protein A1355_16635 [Methylomonas koyamae]
MRKYLHILLAGIVLLSITSAALADNDARCGEDGKPRIEFVELESIKLAFNPSIPGGVVDQGPLTVKGKLMLPAEQRCRSKKHRFPAVVILHGSSGIDSRGDFYATELNEGGIATLEIDMWEARGVSSAANRPALPILTYPDAFAALEFLSQLPYIDPDRIGVLGFSWGGVMTMASATEVVSQRYGADLRFAAHVANYPVCYGYNNPSLPYFSFGGQAGNPLTGAPIMIQIGEMDGYDESPAPCETLKASLTNDEQAIINVVSYPGSEHAWDRLMVPITVSDSFAHLGLGGVVNLTPNVEQAYIARQKTVRFFQRNL